MALVYKRQFTQAKISEAYEALIVDALRGDYSNFVCGSENVWAWKVRRACRGGHG